MPRAPCSVQDVEASLWACVEPVHWQTLAPRTQAARVRARQRIDQCVQQLIESPLTPMPTARRGGGSERQLQRDFAATWGVSLKLVQRLLRLQLGIQWWRQAIREEGAKAQLADLAASLGLVDQAHLTREFRELVGEPPSALKALASTDPALNVLWALEQGGALLLPLLQATLVAENSKTLPAPPSSITA